MGNTTTLYHSQISPEVSLPQLYLSFFIRKKCTRISSIYDYLKDSYFTETCKQWEDFQKPELLTSILDFHVVGMLSSSIGVGLVS